MADLKDVSEPVSAAPDKDALSNALVDSAVQAKFKSIIDRYPKIKEKVAQIKGASMGDSIVSDVKAEKQRKKIKLIKKMEELLEGAKALLAKIEENK